MKCLDIWIEKVPILPGSQTESKVAYIVVQQSSTGPNGESRISAECRTAKEVEEWADFFIGELQAIKRKAKKKL